MFEPVRVRGTETSVYPPPPSLALKQSAPAVGKCIVNAARGIFEPVDGANDVQGVALEHSHALPTSRVRCRATKDGFFVCAEHILIWDVSNAIASIAMFLLILLES